MPLIKTAQGFMKKTYKAGAGKLTSKGITQAATGTSSGAMQSLKNTRVAQYAMKNKGKTAAMGMGGMAAGGYMLQGRRGRGVDKFQGGRPTGMYGR
jgi:hypothetical protein